MRKEKQELADKQARHARISADLAKLRQDLSECSARVRAAQELSKRLTLESILNPSPATEKEVERVRKEFAEAFERETELRDRVPLMEVALNTLSAEMDSLRKVIEAGDNGRVLEVLSARGEQTVKAIRDAAAALVAEHLARHPGTWEGQIALEPLIMERIRNLRSEIIADARNLASQIVAEGEGAAA